MEKLEALLAARPIEPKQLSETLMGEYYGLVYRLALAELNNHSQAHAVALQTFVEVLIAAQRYNRRWTPRAWLCALALKVAQSPRSWSALVVPTPSSAVKPSDHQEAILWRVIDSTRPKERRLWILFFGLGLSIPEIAKVLGVGPTAVEAQLRLNWRDYQAALGIPAQEAQGHIEELSRQVVDSLNRRWPAPTLTNSAIARANEQIQAQAAQQAPSRRRAALFRTVALVSMSGLLITCMVLAMMEWVMRNAPSQATKALGNTPLPPTATAVTPAVKAEPLSRGSSAEEILARWLQSDQLWNTLWLDAQIIDYGPVNYIGPPQIYHAQAWISQPGQSLELFGNLPGDASRLTLVSPSARIIFNRVTGETQIEARKYQLSEFLESQYLRVIIFPANSPWATSNGSFKAEKYQHLAGRRALVVDWYDNQGYRGARLWLDLHTGLILRAQNYSRDQTQQLLAEIFVTDIEFDRDFPQANLYAVERLSSVNFAKDFEGTPLKKHEPKLELKLTLRSPLSYQTIPPGYDLSNASLTFQDPSEPVSAAPERTFDLFADGYFYAKVNLFAPWGLRCARSPDGQRLAFSTLGDGVLPASPFLHWFNLASPTDVYQLLPGLRAEHFAFAPDSRHLAVIGKGAGDVISGLYVIDLGTGEYNIVLELLDGRSLAWSPDGENLALIGRMKGQIAESVFVLHVRSKQIIYQLESIPQNYQPVPDWPMTSWGITFPVEMGGMENCAKPAGT